MRVWSLVVATAVALMLVAPAVSAQVRTVNIGSSPQGAQVRLDSPTATPLGATPLRRQRIPAGAHTLYFELAGFVPGRLEITVRRNGETFSGALTQAGSIYVSADVDGAAIFLDGTQAGTTPGRLNGVIPGQHVVEIRQQGMQTARETVTVGAGAVATVNVVLRPPPPQAPTTGTVRVIVTNPAGPLPADLAITLDGAPMLGSPPTNDHAEPGTHILQVAANGFRSTRREVQVSAGQTVVMAVDLEAIQQAPTGGSVRVLVPTPNAQVFLDGELLSGTPPQRENVPAGRHALRVSAQGRATVTRDIQVTNGQVTVTEIPELAVVAEVGRIAVRTSTPGAHVFVDGADVGTSPYERADLPAGAHTVVVRAEGFDEFSQSCTVTPERPCEIVATLEAHRPAVLRVAVNVPTARVLVDGSDRGTAGEITGLAAGPHTLEVRAPGFQVASQQVVLVAGQTRDVTVALQRTGSEVARRRAAISTWGAAPLARGDGAFDAALAYGGMPLEFRATMGLLPYGPLGVDGGLSIRSRFDWTEFELRGRAGYRLLDDVIAVGGELRLYGALGAKNSSGTGITALARVSFHFSLASDEDTATGVSDAARSNRFGSFAFTLHLGVEHNGDSVGQGINLETGDNNALCENAAERRAAAANTTPGTQVPVCVISSTTRGFFGGILEFGLGRHWNLFTGMDYYLVQPDEATATNPGSNTGRRALTADFWDSPVRALLRAGLTYKF